MHKLKNGNRACDLKTHPLCGAKARHGGACRAKAMKNGKCRLHGGKSLKKHGLYTREMREIKRAMMGI